jgi:hypothetical protein
MAPLDYSNFLLKAFIAVAQEEEDINHNIFHQISRF